MCLYRTLYKACFWNSLRHARRHQHSSIANYEMCQVQQTVTNLWQAAHATRNRTRHGRPPFSCSSFTPTTRSSSLSSYCLAFACDSIKMQKDFNASGMKRAPNGACTTLCPLLAVVPCKAGKGCVCKYARKLIKMQTCICFIVRGQYGN